MQQRTTDSSVSRRQHVAGYRELVKSLYFLSDIVYKLSLRDGRWSPGHSQIWDTRPIAKSMQIYKVIPVNGRGHPYGCETSRLPHFLDNRFTDSSNVSA
jgi:hypothetical protein